MTNPITPPPELVQQWLREFLVGTVSGELDASERVLIAVAQWGWDQREPEIQSAADQELEACCEWLSGSGVVVASQLRAARRPKPQTLNSIALQMLGTIEREAYYLPEITDTIRRAIEALPDD